MKIFELDIFGFTLSPTYYGLMYALGMIFGYLIIKKRAIIADKLLDDLVFYIFLGIILGGRFGYILFYNFSTYIHSPLDIFKVWEGGMSFHGGVIGVIIAMMLFARRYKLSFYQVADEICLVLPIGLGLGRIGNYLNAELLGYSNYTGPLAINGRFPSPLLEFFLEGIVLFGILYWFSKQKHFPGQLASLFLIGYGVFRIFVEVFFRTPDAHIGYLWGFMTLGTLLSIPMIIAGIGFYIYLGKNTNATN